MKYGMKSFSLYLDQVKELTVKAAVQDNPALWLFRSNARTPFFMLEALSRLYEKMSDHKRFGRLRDSFKLMEDYLGRIDYFQFLDDSFAEEKSVPQACRKYVKNRLDEATGELNEYLNSKGWLSDDPPRLKKISRKLNHAEWPRRDEEAKGLKDIYRSAVKKTGEFVKGTGFRFDNVEEDVHELRRRLRWLSIYPQALRGAIQFAPVAAPPVYIKKYLTPEIVNSPYNQLPASGDPLLLLDKNHFLALSWMIAILGNLKDEGLLISGLAEAIAGTEGVSIEEAHTRAESLLPGKRKTSQILDEAEAVSRTWFREKCIDRLIA